MKQLKKEHFLTMTRMRKKQRLQQKEIEDEMTRKEKEAGKEVEVQINHTMLWIEWEMKWIFISAPNDFLQNLQTNLSSESGRAWKIKNAWSHQQLPSPRVYCVWPQLWVSNGLRKPPRFASTCQGKW